VGFIGGGGGFVSQLDVQKMGMGREEGRKEGMSGKTVGDDGVACMRLEWSAEYRGLGVEVRGKRKGFKFLWLCVAGSGAGELSQAERGAAGGA